MTEIIPIDDAKLTEEMHYRLLAEGAREYAIILMDEGGRITLWNAGAERVLGWGAGEVLGKPADLIFTPEDCAADVPAQELAQAAAQGQAMDLRWHIKKDGSRFFADGILEALRADNGELHGFVKILRDATEEGKRKEREHFLAALTERARGMIDPDTVITDALHSVGTFLGVSRCVFVDIDVVADICTCHPDYRRDDTVESMAGTFPISAFGAIVVAAYGAGRAVTVEDVRNDPAQVPPENIAAYDALNIRAHVGIPVVHSSRLVSCIGVHSSVPRVWMPEEVDLIKTVVERTWLTVEVMRQQQALMREAAERRETHERTGRILESITDSFFTLDHEWRFTYLNAQAEQLLSRTRADLLGKSVWEEFPAAVGSDFDRQYRHAIAEQTAVSFEAYYPPPLDIWFEVRAFPSPDGLSVFFQNVSERKKAEEERERMAERERNIAQQLQAALTPSVPERIPGMALAKYYEAALNEAQVGGDFYDIFPVEKGCTALIVGDLSGKGLAAASQVATVRNMLRYALYRSRTIVGALSSLNALLVEQNLLSGFATLFVGAYDSGTGTLTYVNCGQEPALVKRSKTSLVELLVPTGPVLGSFENASFEEHTVALSPGDALAVFTDGLTEVGPSRREMLGIQGVASLLAEPVTPEDVLTADGMAEAVAIRLISGVDAYAEMGARDDMCLLIAVVT